jgi:uncharacterized protein YndB with AHSA1/START domain
VKQDNTDDYGIATAADTVRIERTLPGPIERVWRYLTDSDKRASWLAGGTMDLRVGGLVELRFRNAGLSADDDAPPAKYAGHIGEIPTTGRITACEAPRLLSYTWGGEGDGASEVSFELSPQGDQVRLVLTHRRLADRNAMLSVAAGWHAHLGILVDTLSGRRPESFWTAHTRLEAEYGQRLPPDRTGDAGNR